MSDFLVSLHFNNTDCLGTPSAATVMKHPCKETQLPFVKTFCGDFEKAQKVFHQLHPGKPLFEADFYHDKNCKNPVYSAISLADKECHYFGSIHPHHNGEDESQSTTKNMAYKGGKHHMKVFFDQKECKKSPDFKIKVSKKCQKFSHGKHEMFGTLSYTEIKTPFMETYAFWGLIAVIFVGLWAMLTMMTRKAKVEGRGKYQPVMI